MKDNSELTKRFETAIELGKKGNVDNYDIWLKKLGINSNRLSPEKFKLFIYENPNKIVDRLDEIEVIAKFTGYFIENQNILYHLVLYGVEGVGKSILIEIIKQLIQKYYNEIVVEIIDAHKFINLNKDGDIKFWSYYTNIKNNRPDILIIDSCNKSKNIDEYLDKFAKLMNPGLIITLWDTLTWNYFRDIINDNLPITEEINILPFDLENTISFINAISNFISDHEFLIDKKLYEKIWSYSKGIPLLIFTLLVFSLQEAYTIKIDSINENIITKAAKRMNLYNIDNKLDKVSEIQYLILKKMLLNIDERGIRPIILATDLNKDQATIAYHMNALLNEKIIRRDKIGKYTFYKIQNNLKPIIQNRISRGNEFLD